tara:strand:+ start:591 stop:929 length:339 start_codon:yes stop_codon:yes gene_type:complete
MIFRRPTGRLRFIHSRGVILRRWTEVERWEEIRERKSDRYRVGEVEEYNKHAQVKVEAEVEEVEVEIEAAEVEAAEAEAAEVEAAEVEAAEVEADNNLNLFPEKRSSLAHGF